MIVVRIPFIVKFLQDNWAYRKKTSKNINRYFCSSFQGHMLGVFRCTNTGKLNCRCQELDPAHITVSCMLMWRVFTPPGEFYSQSKNVRNIDTNVSIVRKIPPSHRICTSQTITPSSIRAICVYFHFWGNLNFSY